MTKKQDTLTYELKQGNKVVYVGTTNDPERREQQHREDGKKLGHMNVTSRRMTEDGAKRKEAERLTTYRKNQGGIQNTIRILTVNDLYSAAVITEPRSG